MFPTKVSQNLRQWMIFIGIVEGTLSRIILWYQYSVRIGDYIIPLHVLLWKYSAVLRSGTIPNLLLLLLVHLFIWYDVTVATVSGSFRVFSTTSSCFFRRSVVISGCVLIVQERRWFHHIWTTDVVVMNCTTETITWYPSDCVWWSFCYSMYGWRYITIFFFPSTITNILSDGRACHRKKLLPPLPFLFSFSHSD